MVKTKTSQSRENARLRKKNARLEQRVAELEEELSLKTKDIRQYRRLIYWQGDIIKNQRFDKLRMFAETIEARDPYTRGHSDRVTKYSILIGRAMNLSEKDINLLHNAAHLHDIGKLYWDGEDFRKRSLTKEERRKFRDHAVKGAEYLEKIAKDNPEYKEICKIIRYHHEHYGGISILTHYDEKYAGYPGELSGDDIPLLSRIIAVADSLDAMTTDRPYKKRRSFEEALEELKRCSGLRYRKRIIPSKKSEIQFDPKVVKALLSVKTIGSRNKRTSHKLGCSYVLKIDSMDYVINPRGYTPCKSCIRYAS